MGNDPMIIQGNTKFINAPFSSEEELETVVQANAELIFGPDSVYLPKAIIRTSGGTGTVPDGFVIDIAARRWFIVEAELANHSVWNHIAPQVTKQIIAASQPASRRALTELVVNRVKENPHFRDKFDDVGVHEIDIPNSQNTRTQWPRFSMMDIDDEHNHMRAAFGLRYWIGQSGTPAAE